MKNKEQVEQLIRDALNSIDGIKRATPRPYLFARINGRFEKQTKTLSENIAVVISRPVVVFSGLCLLIALNIIVIVWKGSTENNTVAGQLSSQTTDDYTASFAVIDNIENQEP